MKFFNVKNILDFMAFLTTTLYLSCLTYFTDPPPSTLFSHLGLLLAKVFISFLLSSSSVRVDQKPTTK